MTYVATQVFGKLDPWAYPTAGAVLHQMTQRTIMVLRLTLAGVKLSSPDDALYFVKAVGQGQNWGMDVRGVAVSSTAPESAQVDVIMTKADMLVGGYWNPGVVLATTLAPADDATSMAKKVAQNPTIIKAFPKMSIVGAVLGELLEPEDAKAHWLAQPVLWDHLLKSQDGPGGPTDAFVHPTPGNVVHGTADDGPRAKPWPKSILSLGPADAERASKFLMFGVAAAAVAGVAYVVSRRQKGE
jgi:hypothetical protein